MQINCYCYFGVFTFSAEVADKLDVDVVEGSIFMHVTTNIEANAFS